MTADLLRSAVESRVTDVIPEPTPLDPAPLLSERLGLPVLLKREDLTPVFSFKLRGAYHRMSGLRPEEAARGVVAASAGNHAQGVAYSARRLGIEARIVMPRTTPPIKVAAVRRLGATIELHGDSYSDAAERAAALVQSSGAIAIHPFDDLEVIAGQGTVALEILQKGPRDLAAILVPIGGGGLAAGVAAVVKELRPSVRVLGVQVSDSDAMRRSLAAGERVRLDHVGIFADGVAVKQVGEQTLALCRRYLDGIVTVGVDEICGAIQDAFADTRSILEPAGALSIAGLSRLRAEGGLPRGPVVAVASGANMPFARLGHVAERAGVGQLREALFVVTIPERPGSFLEFAGVLGSRNVTEFNYRLGRRDAAEVFVGVEVTGAEEAQALEAALRAHGYQADDLSHDDLAMTHLRHMVGGRAASAHDEAFFSFEFPERPGALREFLRALGTTWNISLFHYRNHGSAYGRVLAGFEVPPAERGALRDRLGALGFPFEDESGSPAIRLLRA